jgi:hypothetical protein
MGSFLQTRKKLIRMGEQGEQGGGGGETGIDILGI